MMNIAVPAFLIQVIFAASCAASLTDAPSGATGPYLGQRPPGDKPEVLAPGTVSSNDRFEHSHLLIAKDGRALFWAAQPAGSRRGIGEQSIWRMQQGADGGWSNPEALPVSLIGLASPVHSPDGKVLYFTAVEEKPGVDPRNSPHQMHAVSADFEELSDAVSRLAPLAKCWSFSIADNGNVYFESSDNETPERDLCLMERDGDHYGPLRKLGGAVNSGAPDVHPWIAPDERTLIFASWRPGGYGGADLYVSFRGSDGNWTPAQNLGPAVNSGIMERFPSLSPDGRYLFFTRNGSGGSGEVSDFFWVSTVVLDRLRPSAAK